MARQKNLKQRLKASDKRRRRRASTAGAKLDEPAVSTQVVSRTSQRNRFLGLAVQSILDQASNFSPSDADQVAVAALRACQKEAEPSGEQARELASQLYQLRAAESFDADDFLHVIKQLLDTASEQHELAGKKEDRHGDEFVSYLALFAE